MEFGQTWWNDEFGILLVAQLTQVLARSLAVLDNDVFVREVGRRWRGVLAGLKRMAITSGCIVLSVSGIEVGRFWLFDHAAVRVK
jgi:hypothetical protein